MDPYEIGWYIESADEEIYGPVSRQALRGLLDDRTITPNTLVRHCTQPESRPVLDQPVLMERFVLEQKASAVGDRLAEAWPRKTRDRQALAEDSLPCAWHKRPAVAVCIRCRAPYCNSCRAKPFRKQFFLCRRCQTNSYNRRCAAWILDIVVILYLPLFLLNFVLGALGLVPFQAQLIIYIADFALICFLFVRDSLFGGAGLGKRALGLRVVQSGDGTTPLTHRQGVVRWLSQWIPFFNLVDLSVPFRDPLLRRYGDRWAGTRVLDSEPALAKARAKIAKRLIKKGVEPARELGMTIEEFARIA